jgi:Ca2+-binding RTX toxin-like protein
MSDVYSGAYTNTLYLYGTDNSAELAKSGTITTASVGFEEDGLSNVLTVKGTITLNPGAGTVAVKSSGFLSTVVIEQGAEISGSVGLYMSGEYFVASNKGTISGSLAGVGFIAGSSGTFINSGLVEDGISSQASDLYISNVFGGEIEKGIVISGKAVVETEVENHGTIYADTATKLAFSAVNSTDKVTNHWLMGSVDLGDKDDIFLNYGQVLGTVAGGTGNDTFGIYGDQSLKILEKAGEGTDTVLSDGSIDLGAGDFAGQSIENLTLTGNSGLFGSGNALDNIVIGNTAGNTLSGRGGHDSLQGGGGDDDLSGGIGNDKLAGGDGEDSLVGGNGEDRLSGDNNDDVLTGGGGADVFIFATGSGVDRITDFQNGLDRINVKGFTGIDDFGDVKAHLKVSGDDLVIKVGTDKLVIEDTLKSELDAADFAF